MTDIRNQWAHCPMLPWGMYFQKVILCVLLAAPSWVCAAPLSTEALNLRLEVQESYTPLDNIDVRVVITSPVRGEISSWKTADIRVSVYSYRSVEKDIDNIWHIASFNLESDYRVENTKTVEGGDIIIDGEILGHERRWTIPSP